MRITLIKVIITLFLFTEKVTCTSSDNGILSTPSRLLCCHFTSFSFLPIFVSRVLCTTNLELMLKMRQITTVDNDVAVIWRVFINCFAGFFTDLELMLKICQITTLLASNVAVLLFDELFTSFLTVIIIFVLQKRSPVRLTTGSYTNLGTPLMTKPAKAGAPVLTPAILFVNPSIVPQVSSEEVRTLRYELMGLSINIFLGGWLLNWSQLPQEFDWQYEQNSVRHCWFFGKKSAVICLFVPNSAQIVEL